MEMKERASIGGLFSEAELADGPDSSRMLREYERVERIAALASAVADRCLTPEGRRLLDDVRGAMGWEDGTDA